MRRALLVLSILLASCGGGWYAARAEPGSAETVRVARANSATLIMIDDPACHYCQLWNKEVGGGYGRTAEGRAAPLQRVRRGSKLLRNFAPVIYTPTFILVRNGREVGRITGYPGQLYFWEELAQMFASAGIKTKG